MRPHEQFNLADLYVTHAEVCRRLGNVVQTVGLRFMKALKYEPVNVAGRIHWYRADLDDAAAYVAKHGLPPAYETDAWLEQRKLEASYGVPANGQFTVPSV